MSDGACWMAPNSRRWRCLTLDGGFLMRSTIVASKEETMENKNGFGAIVMVDLIKFYFVTMRYHSRSTMEG